MAGDLYCAICGGPLRPVDISSVPRNESFYEALERGEELGDWDERHKYDLGIITPEDAEWTANAGLLGFNPTVQGNDQGFMTVEGYDDGNMRIFVTHIGREMWKHTDFIEIRGDFAAYHSDDDDEVGFPIHPPCYGVFRSRLACELGGYGMGSSVNRGVLYGVLLKIPAPYRCLEIDHGYPPPGCEDQSWRSRAGEEIFAADPSPIKQLEESITELIADGFFDSSLTIGEKNDLSHKVRHDPFTRLPFDIILRIGESLDSAESLLGWTGASWFVHAQLGSAGWAFWKRAIQAQLRWFYELQPCIHDYTLRKGSAMRSVYLWAALQSKPRLWMKGGFFLRLANRRRIWTTPCGDLVKRYCKAMYPKDGDDRSEFQRLLHSDAACGTLYSVTRDSEVSWRGGVHRCLWIDEWEDTYTKSQTIEAFFRKKDGWLVGIAVTTEGTGERRIVGSTDEQGSLSLRCEAIVPADDWICGILLHIQDMDMIVEDGVIKPPRGDITSIKGLTFNCKSGLDLHLGEVDRGHLLRPLLARSGRQIVGIAVQNGESFATGDSYADGTAKETLPEAPVHPFTRFGLMTIWDTQLGSRTILPDKVARLRWDEMEVGNILWQDDGLRYFDLPYWNNPSLRFIEYGSLPTASWHRLEDDDHLAGHHVLLWARNAAEVQQLKTISIFTTLTRDPYQLGTDEDSNSDAARSRAAPEDPVVCGLGVEYSGANAESPRMVGHKGRYERELTDEDAATVAAPRMPVNSDGSTKKTDGYGNFRIDLDIDGPGGEVITEVSYCVSSSIHAGPQCCLKFRTNKDREVGCILHKRPNPDWHDPEELAADPEGLALDWVTLQTPPGRTMVGLIVTFGLGRVNGKGKHTGYKALRSVAAIAMQVGIGDEGSIPDSDDYYEDSEGFSAQGELEGVETDEDSQAGSIDGEIEGNSDDDAGSGDDEDEWEDEDEDDGSESSSG